MSRKSAYLFRRRWLPYLILLLLLLFIFVYRRVIPNRRRCIIATYCDGVWIRVGEGKKNTILDYLYNPRFS